MPDAQLPTTLHEDSDVEFHGGLSATFILDFARAIVRQYPMTVDPTQVKVLLLDKAGLENVKCVPFEGSSAPLYLFVLVKQHWTFML